MSKIPNLFVIMNEKGISQKQLAEYIGASTGNISDWKSGKSAPTIERLIEIAHYFNVSTDYLLGIAPNIKPDAPQLDPADQELLTLFHDLTLDQQSFIVTTINALVVKNDSEARKKDV